MRQSRRGMTNGGAQRRGVAPDHWVIADTPTGLHLWAGRRALVDHKPVGEPYLCGAVVTGGDDYKACLRGAPEKFRRFVSEPEAGLCAVCLHDYREGHEKHERRQRLRLAG